MVFESELKKLGPYLAIPWKSSKPTFDPLPSILVERFGEDDLNLYLLREADKSSLKIRHHEKIKQWNIEDAASPVIELSRCYCEEGLIRRGRLFYYSKFLSKNGQWEHKDQAFVKWADAVLKTMPRVAKKSKEQLVSEVFIGEDAKGKYFEKKYTLTEGGACVTLVPQSFAK